MYTCFVTPRLKLQRGASQDSPPGSKASGAQGPGGWWSVLLSYGNLPDATAVDWYACFMVFMRMSWNQQAKSAAEPPMKNHVVTSSVKVDCHWCATKCSIFKDPLDDVEGICSAWSFWRWLFFPDCFRLYRYSNPPFGVSTGTSVYVFLTAPNALSKFKWFK